MIRPRWLRRESSCIWKVGLRAALVAGMIWLVLVGAASAQTVEPPIVHVTGSPFSAGGALSVSFSANANLLATANRSGVSLFTVQPDGSLSHVADFPTAGGQAESVAFSPSGNFLAAANVVINGVEDGVEMFRVDPGPTLVSVGTAETGGGPVGVDALAFSPSGALLASANADTVSVFAVQPGGTLSRTDVIDTSNPAGAGNGTSPQMVRFGRGGNLLATANVGPDPNTVSVFTVGNGGTLAHVPGSPFAITNGFFVRALAFSPSGDLLATANADTEFQGQTASTVSLFALNGNGSLRELAGSPFPTSSDLAFDHPYGIAFSPSGGLVATGNYFSDSVSLFAVDGDPTLRLLTGSSPVSTSTAGRNGASPYSIVFSPRRGLLATANQSGSSVSVFKPVGGFVITKTAAAHVAPGGVLQYTITLTPSGPAGGAGTVTDNLLGVLNKATYQNDAQATTGAVSFDSTTGLLHWIGRLFLGQTATITYSVKVGASANGLLRNSVDGPLGSSCAGGAPGPPCVHETEIRKPTPPPPPPPPASADLALTKTASESSVVPGGQVLYTLAVRNNGPGDATGVTVQDPLPAGVFFQSAEPSQACAVETVQVVCRLGTIPAGGGALVQITATVATDATGTLTNMAKVYGAQPDPDLANNTVSSHVTVSLQPPQPPDPGPQPVADLVIAKHVSHARLTVGGRLTYTITVTNRGGDPARDVRVVDVSRLPASVRSVHASRGSCRIARPIRCTLGTLQPSARATITIHATASAAGVQINTVGVTSGSWDSATATNLARARTLVIRRPAAPRFTG